ncbi:hypothetical protein [Candidatus Odyssella thessalonicensis]|uniref:hypothetical protein n=1 Tax=Candidatus Odyssella thessalonicensis TaxID=84647 RepID=UPI000225B19D|nr:hypothetical protein [Candidatus Odyssella thessalonicensis]
MEITTKNIEVNIIPPCIMDLASKKAKTLNNILYTHAKLKLVKASAGWPSYCFAGLNSAPCLLITFEKGSVSKLYLPHIYASQFIES